ncbi:MAG: helix-turn-helix transcriptional regulator [Lachnospiraceae bacterium]|nr:helix-turn-helix transcriptional regulator [Lachnospiraceae bacterium]
MPRSSFCRDPDADLREVLFGISRMSDLSKRTGITEQTLSRRKENPRDLKYGELEAICKAQGLKIVITKPDFVIAGG